MQLPPNAKISRTGWKRKLLRLSAIACIAFALAAIVLARVQIPGTSAPAHMDGLSAAVPIDLDARAVPTVHAATLLDALRAEGYLVARERMFELDLERRAAAGTLSEVFGAATLERDRLQRLYGLRRVADEAVNLLPPEQRAEAEAYASGVNAFIKEHPFRCGLEFDMLGEQPSPWTVSDSLLVTLLMYEDLSESWKDEFRAEALAALPAAQQRFLMPRVTDDDLLIVPDAEPRPRADAPALFEAPHASWTPLRVPPDVAGLPPWAGERERGLGSNNWVIGPRRSKTGKPLLANDPHLPLTAPGLWYELRIELPSRWVQGMAIPGIPGIVIGQNDRIAWGFTALGADVQDVYHEPATSERVERIHVRASADVELRVPIGRHGPQVRPGYSIAWVALDPANVRLPVCKLMLASDWSSFNDAADDFYGPTQNVVYADVDGHIGWRVVGVIPKRREGDEGLLPHDGTDPNDDWRGTIPMSEMPRVLDPPAGYIATANQRTIGTSFPYVVNANWVSPVRARRIAELIEKAGTLDRDDVERMQLDVVSNFHRDLMQLVAQSVPSLDRFRSWDGAAEAGSTMFLEARAWEAGLIEAIDARLLGVKAGEFSWNNDDESILAAMRADESAWLRAGLGDKKSLLEDAEARANAKLRRSSARTWGSRNALKIQHPIGSVGGPLAWLFNPPSVPQPGEYDTVRLTGPSFGQSFRFIADLGDPTRTTGVIPLGQSGHLGSPHRLDQFSPWLTGDPGGALTRFEQPKVESLILTP